MMDYLDIRDIKSSDCTLDNPLSADPTNNAAEHAWHYMVIFRKRIIGQF